MRLCTGSAASVPTSERFWMNLQTRYDLEIEKDRPGRSLMSYSR